jgi:large subunit ribosomal protein L30
MNKKVNDTNRKIKIQLVKSLIGRLQAHKDCAIGLGLRRINQVVEVINTKENRGMINQISYLLKCED